MQKSRVRLVLCLIGLCLATMAPRADAQSKDEQAIRRQVQRLHTAIKAKDIRTIMTVYVPDESLVVFDVVPPRQFVGAQAYRKNFEALFTHFPGPVELVLTDLHISASGTLGFVRSITSIRLTDPQGKPFTLVSRVTDIYHKIKGKWLIIHEHASVPVDLETGKADLLSKP